MAKNCYHTLSTSNHVKICSLCSSEYNFTKETFADIITKQKTQGTKTITTCTLVLHFALAIPRWKHVQHNYWYSQVLHHPSANTHTHIQPFTQQFNGPLSQTTRVGWYQKKHSHTHTYPESRSSNILYQLPPSTMIHGILLVQFTSLTVLFHNLSPGPLCKNNNILPTDAMLVWYIYATALTPMSSYVSLSIHNNPS